MSFALVCLVALGASMLTFFSGFGLGTLLLPAFAVFFPLPLAIAATAVVHLANNLFKLGLVGRHAVRRIVLRFGLSAAAAAFAGAWLLLHLAALRPLFEYELLGRTFQVLPLGLVLAILIGFFALFELVPALVGLRFEPSFLALGGALSGFFGGLSGHQGALRAAFLAKCSLGPEAFVGTGVACAVLVDVARLAVYGVGKWSVHLATLQDERGGWLVLAATLSAFTGAWLGRQLLRKMTLHGIQLVVGVMLLLLAACIGAGLV